MILKSMLDSDLYKLSMQQAILELYSATQVEYRFYNRRPSDTFGEKFVEALKSQIQEKALLTGGSRETGRAGDGQDDFAKPV
jgi:nicotinate phosphoribosyltransferase